MKREQLIIGVDTSNYTTSVAVLSIDGRLIANLKRPLPVKSGECGLRQSDAVFAHVKNMPSIMEEARAFIQDAEIVAVGVSERPRNTDGSYMPCFLTGLAVAESICAATGAKLYRFSHQCGHIMAALYSAKKTDLASGSFYAFHVSGGTTELVRATGDGQGFKTEIIGGTNDLNAGQAIDRTGVMMELPFPSGKYIEELALSNTGRLPRKNPSVEGLNLNLSGLQNLAEKLYKETTDKALVSAFVLNYIGEGIRYLRDECIMRYGDLPFVYAGGVMSNTLIKKMLTRENSFFAEPMLSQDNAVGIAYLASLSFGKEK